MLTWAKTLVFIPDYRFFSVRDYSTVDHPGAADALTRAHADITAASDYEIFVVCAQDSIKIDLTVRLYDDEADLPHTTDATARYTIPFPTAVLHAGDAFGTTVTTDLPHDGSYTVVVEHTGRDEATRLQHDLIAQTMDLHGDELSATFDRWAGTERYRVTLAPTVHPNGHA